MTATRVSASPAGLAVTTSAAPAPSFADTVRSEWTKTRTLRSTPVTLTVTGLLVVGLSALITWASLSSPHHGADFLADPLRLVQSGWDLGFLAAAVLGVLVVTNEYASGMIVSTLLGTPKRLRVLAAKTLVFASLVFVVTEVMAFANFYVGHAVASGYPAFPDPALGQENVLRAVIGAGIEATLVGLMGLALGAILRHTAGAITASVAILFVLPLITLALPTSWRNSVEEYWPTQAGEQIREVARLPHALTAWWGTGDLALFVAVLLVVAGYMFQERDA
jgi:ABC-2 type transport system permease protein